MSELKKKCTIVLLDTEKDTDIVLNPTADQLLNAAKRYGRTYPNIEYKKAGFKPKHLYVCINEEFDINDWVITQGGFIRKCTGKRPNGDRYVCVSEHNLVLTSHCRKIIATTDNSLKFKKDERERDFGVDISSSRAMHFPEYSLPTVSDGFLDAYIKAHNKREPITDVMVEYHGSFGHYDGDAWEAFKLRGNEIIISKMKETFTYAEVEKLLGDYGADVALAANDKRTIPYYGDWLQEHI